MRITERRLRRIIRQVISENTGIKPKIQKITLEWWKLNIKDLENKLNYHDLHALRNAIVSQNNAQLLDDLDLDLSSGKIQEHNRVFILLVNELFTNRSYRSWITSAEPILGSNIAIQMTEGDFSEIENLTSKVFFSKKMKKQSRNKNPLHGMTTDEINMYMKRLDIKGLTKGN